MCSACLPAHRGHRHHRHARDADFAADPAAAPQLCPIQLIQLPVALVFGTLTDAAVWAIQGISVQGYAARWLVCAVEILLVGIGVSFEVTANVVTLAGEGVVLAVCRAFGTPFPKTKVGFDVTLVLIASTLSLLFLHRLEGVREGTVAAAILVGMVAKQVNRPMQRFSRRFLES